jgi:hypothetical protein
VNVLVVSARITRGFACKQLPSHTAMSSLYAPGGRSPGGDSHQALSVLKEVAAA